MALKIRLEIDSQQIRSIILDSQSNKQKLDSSVAVESGQNLVKALQLSFEKIAQKMRQDIHTFLKKVELIEIVTTLGETILEDRTGIRVGLFVTKGCETSVLNNSKISAFLQNDLVVGIDEEVNTKGKVIKELKEDEVRGAIRSLLDGGAEVIVASFKNAAINPHNEVLCQEVMVKNFPRYYLGGVPFQKSVEVTDSNDFTLRTNLAVMNAYLKSGIASRLYALGDEIWKMGYRNPIHLIDARGRSIPLAKVLPVATLTSEKAAPLRMEREPMKIRRRIRDE
jgi:N-methylhydantoinase A/oxoprolinase/acetone carboxylase beta subunit